MTPRTLPVTTSTPDNRAGLHPGDHKDRPRGRCAAAAAVAAAAALCAAPHAAAQGYSPSGNSGVDEYVESLPYAEGDRPSAGHVGRGGSGGGGAGSGGGAGASGGSVESTGDGPGSGAASGGEEAAVLERVDADAARRAARRRDKDAPGEAGSAPSAVADTVVDPSSPAGPIVAGLALLIAAAAALVGIRRLRAARR